MQGESGHARRPPAWLLVLVVVAVAVVLWGGYTHRWPWTGINGHTATLWDWLHLLLLPLAVAVLPIWLSRDAKLDPAVKRAAVAGAAVFAVIVLAGYLVPWAWTGFAGNSFWDWLNLVALPLAVALTPLAIELRDVWTGRHTRVVVVVAAVFGLLVLGGYLGDWKWTGFTGNTLWDWLHLLLLPLLLPIVVVPVLLPKAKAKMIELEHAAESQDPPVAAPARDAPMAAQNPTAAGQAPSPEA